MTDEFIDNTVAMAAGYALWFAGVPGAEVMRHLLDTRANLEADLAEMYGHDVAAAIAEAFVVAVVRRRAEIEAAGAMQRAVN